ncbi:unnamed protein product [Caenorhabditis nigoni]
MFLFRKEYSGNDPSKDSRDHDSWIMLVVKCSLDDVTFTAADPEKWAESVAYLKLQIIHEEDLGAMLG